MNTVYRNKAIAIIGFLYKMISTCLKSKFLHIRKYRFLCPFLENSRPYGLSSLQSQQKIRAKKKWKPVAVAVGRPWLINTGDNLAPTLMIISVKHHMKVICKHKRKLLLISWMVRTMTRSPPRTQPNLIAQICCAHIFLCSINGFAMSRWKGLVCGWFNYRLLEQIGC